MSRVLLKIGRYYGISPKIIKKCLIHPNISEYKLLRVIYRLIESKLSLYSTYEIYPQYPPIEMFRSYFSNFDIQACLKNGCLDDTQIYESDIRYENKQNIMYEDQNEIFSLGRPPSHGISYQYILKYDFFPLDLRKAFEVLIEDITGMNQYQIEVRLIYYFFEEDEDNYILGEHEDNNSYTILVYLERDNVKDIFYIQDEAGKYELVPSEQIWKNNEILVLKPDLRLSDGEFMQTASHKGVFKKINKNKSGKRVILSIMV